MQGLSGMESKLMKRLWFAAILAASVTACVEGNNPVQLVSAIPLSPENCDLGSVSLIKGTLNFNAGTSYRMAFTLFSPLETGTGDTTNPVGFYAEEVILSYETKNPKVSLSEESTPIYFAVPAGADASESYIQVNLIGSEARRKLDTAVPTAPDFMTVLATVKLKGKLPSGKTVETNEVTYPIDITRDRGCEAGSVPVQADPEGAPCGYPGQDLFFNTFNCVPAGG